MEYESSTEKQSIVAENKSLRNQLGHVSERLRTKEQVAGTQTEWILFLSHFKDQAGSEARQLKKSLIELMGEDFPCLEDRIFLDSDHLHDLQNLTEQVKKSNNFVLLLTKDVLSRPWVLIELTTAIESGKHIILIDLQKGFDFSCVEKYSSHLEFAAGITKECLSSIKEHAISIESIQKAVAEAFNTIAKPVDFSRSSPRVLQSQLLDVKDVIIIPGDILKLGSVLNEINDSNNVQWECCNCKLM